jgi:hypothetical protein
LEPVAQVQPQEMCKVLMVLQAYFQALLLVMAVAVVQVV